ncbi:MAG: hypothetical protein O7D30_02220 [Rickettsia endosymbiont of Ixodes persulcatus]|nr:hypothetical protein [Rickettsia endosymbiont of Ixodes persulcatus]
MIDYTTSVHTTAKTYDAGLRQLLLEKKKQNTQQDFARKSSNNV